MTIVARAAGWSVDRVEMAHGAGGKATRRLLDELLVPAFGRLGLDELTDVASLQVDGAHLAMTTDSFVVRPLRFPGGSIGELAVNGTVNDLAVGGAAPLAMVVALIVEAGLEGSVLVEEIEALAGAAATAGIRVVGGDTKVVEHGKADGLYITTTGLGRREPRLRCSAGAVRPGDRVLLSGPIGDHGVAVLLARKDITLEAEGLRSDTRPLWPFVSALAERVGPHVRWMRDPTRGGVATALAELSRDAEVRIVIEEDAIPVHDQVRGACELLGLDVLHMPNEGQFIAVVAASAAESAVAAIRSVPGGERATTIGEVREGAPGVVAVTASGGARYVDMLVGDPLPRIC